MQNPKPAKNGQINPVPPTPAPAAIAPNGAQVLDDIASFIRRYLVCDEHRLTLLTLWSASTRCHHLFSTAPFLHICSPQPYCGKSLCLSLLCNITDAGIVFTGVPAAPLLDRLIQGRSMDTINERAPVFPFTVLMDDCHHSFGLSERQPLVALLNSGSDGYGFFSWGDDDYNLFGPKAFAGNSPLPASLASRCIPIQLRRPKPSEKYVRYPETDAGATAEALRDRLIRWLQQVAPAIDQAINHLPPDLPPTLSPGQIRCAEPMINIADVAGGHWPAKIRSALFAVFDLAGGGPELQILFDIRAIFHDRNNPDYLATRDLLSRLSTLESRPWSAWTKNSGRRLAHHLRPFGIISRRLKLTQEEDFMAYMLADFDDAWERYLPPLRVAVEFPRIEVPSSAMTAEAEMRISVIGAD